MATETSNKLDIPLSAVVLAYQSFWNNIKEQIEDVQMNNIRSLEDVSILPMSFNIPSIGKLYTNSDKIFSTNNRKNKHEDIEHQKS